ncbi:MAG TPA: TIGR03435 family protein [Vicinamibacterales bacterium]|nr:TIGR03435 family protein [Vicinamibacterales bacterium]
MTSRPLRIAVGCVLATTCVFAQGKPTFEVATIKRSTQLEPNGTLRMQPGGLFRSVNIDALTLILGAYRTAERRLFASQVIGAPTWLGVERYDITARVDAELAARPQEELFSKLPLLLQSLLEERFALRLHRDTRDVPVYVLTMKDASLGPRLRQSATDCAATPNLCAIRAQPGYLSAGSADVETLVNLLSSTVDRVIVNRTALSGRFSIELEWSPNQTATDKPSIFTALQEQLGLELESARAPVDVVIIDHVERPTDD